MLMPTFISVLLNDFISLEVESVKLKLKKSCNVSAATYFTSSSKLFAVDLPIYLNVSSIHCDLQQGI